jgi:hypothetical protein
MLIAIGQEFNTPFFGGYIKIFPAVFFFCIRERLQENPWRIGGSSGRIHPGIVLQADAV